MAVAVDHVLVPIGEESPTAAPLVCLPWAGGGTSGFRSWARHVGEGDAVYAVRLPGRESRLSEAPVASMAALAEEVAASIARTVGGPVTLFGLCFGAVLALDVALELERHGDCGVRRLIVASQPAPIAPIDTPAASSTRELLAALGFTDPAVLNDDELLDIVGPAVHADVAALGARRRADVRLHAPVLACRGNGDALVSRDDLLGWEQLTVGGLCLREIEGDHLFTGGSADALATAVLDAYRSEEHHERS